MPAKCALSEDGTVCLRSILQSFPEPIKEEHAWALCHQSAKCFSEALRCHPDRCMDVTDVSHVWLHGDGSVHESTVIAPVGPGWPSDRRPAPSEHELVVGLGIVIFNALDMGYGYGEERAISCDLEQLIDLMASAGDDVSGAHSSDAEHHQETDDEGIERDSGDVDEYNPGPSRRRSRASSGNPFGLDYVLDACSRRVHSRQQADQHYRAVCRALVAEALELSTFLERVSVGARELRPEADGDICKALDRLDFQDWARFWIQVIGELRMGVKLKKVSRSRTPIEYELTPYEILMDDIRSRRYNLKKIMVDGTVPQRVKKDAHAIILEFIRSRPPLRKVSERKLAPLKRVPTPREQLLDSIKRGQSLKPTAGLTNRDKVTAASGQNDIPKCTDDTEKDRPTRRLIKVDFSVLQGDDDDDDDETQGSPPSENIANPWRRTAYDLATQCPTRRASVRRHTLGTCAVEHMLGLPGTQSVPQSRPASRQSEVSSETDSTQLGAVLPEMSWSRSSLQDELIQSKQWQEAMSLDDRLSLTLEEIVHIRSVLTKAELEALPVEGHVKEDAEKRKICFLCLKTRFGLFGPWGQRCKLCKRTVCSKCHSKMKIPTEHFSNVPVVLLSPSLMSSPEDENKDSFPRSLMSRLMVPEGNSTRNSVGSAPSSPSLQRGLSTNSGSISAPGSRVESSLSNCPDGSSPVSTISERRTRMSRAKTLGRPDRMSDRLKGMQMIVCHDCKMMVIQIIKSSRTSRSIIRNNAIRNLTLNLSPVY